MNNVPVSDTYIKRFSWYQVIEHWVSAVLFLSLVITGFSQKFNNLALSQWIVLYFGGIDTVRLIHRISGVLLAFTLGQHLLVAVFGVLFKNWDPSMVITKSDFTNAVTNIKYYIGIVESPARQGRYNYRQKFEYWAILTGSIVMTITGLALWFPTLVTRFLPAEMVPVAKVLHTNEALILMLLVALWHIYNAIFSPEVFPMDTVMFTGKITKERMILEHPLEYENRYGVKLPESIDETAIQGGNIQGSNNLTADV
jgi:formate dehydrogenase subunit gamma